MSTPNQKFVIIPIDDGGGYAKLAFTKISDSWVCKLSDQMMHDLQALLNGEEPREIVKWVDPGINYGNF